MLYYTKLDWVALKVADPTPANSINDINTHPIGFGDHMVNQTLDFVYNKISFIARQNSGICNELLCIAIT